MKNELTENELILLDNLVYLKMDDKYINGGYAVSDIINEFTKNPKLLDESKNDKGKYPGMMSKGEWKRIIKNISNNPKLMNLHVAKIKETKSGMKAMVLVGDKKDITSATVIFRGTTCDDEWMDNAKGGFMADTPGQIEALEFINNISKYYGYKNMTVSGHSKGGNRSQYVALLSDNIDRCISIDGQGFSPEFKAKYAKQIAKNKRKCINIAYRYDYVNHLLHDTVNTIYVGNDIKAAKDSSERLAKVIMTSNPAEVQLKMWKAYFDEMKEFHSPNRLLSRNGKMLDLTVASKAIDELVGLSDRFDEMSLEERTIVYYGFMSLLMEEKGKCPYSIFDAITVLDNHFHLKEKNMESLIDFLLSYSYNNLKNIRDTLMKRIINKGDFLNTLDNSLKQAYRAVLIDPLVIDLNDDKKFTVSTDQGVYFDMDGNGFAEKTAWMDKEDGILVLDKNNNGKIDDGTEIFGDRMTLKTGNKATGAIEALAEYDDNKDGKIDVNDTSYNDIKIWNDKNQNGISEDGEIYTLKDLNISEISLSSKNINKTDENDNKINREISVKIGDKIVTAREYLFKRQPIDSKVRQDIKLTEDALTLPEIDGFGNMYTLRQAVSLAEDSRLKDLINEYINNHDDRRQKELMEEILYVWTGADKIEAGSRGKEFDAKKLHVIETASGTHFVGTRGENPINTAVPFLKQAYEGIEDYIQIQLTIQTKLEGILPYVQIDTDEQTNTTKINLESFMEVIDTFTQIYGDEDYKRELIQNGYLILNEKDKKEYEKHFASISPENQRYIERIKRDSIILSNESDEYKNTTQKNNVIFANAGDDIIETSGGNDTIYGEDGDDTINAGYGNDVIYGGKGNDTLSGYYGADTYIYSRGDGIDTIDEKGSDYTTNVKDRIKFTDINREDIYFSKENDTDISINIKGGAGGQNVNDIHDKIIIKNGHSNCYIIEEIEFADGSIMTYDDMIKEGFKYFGDDADNKLTAYTYDSTVHAGAGNDIINSNSGNDTIYGEDGDDTINAGYGNDVIYGGKGNDTLSGYYGADTYIYSRGDGIDTIDEKSGDYTTNVKDRIKFTDINREDIYFSKENNNDISINIKGGADGQNVNNIHDKIIIKNGHSNCYIIEEIEFADGSMMTYDEYKQLIDAENNSNRVLKTHTLQQMQQTQQTQEILQTQSIQHETVQTKNLPVQTVNEQIIQTMSWTNEENKLDVSLTASNLRQLYEDNILTQDNPHSANDVETSKKGILAKIKQIFKPENSIDKKYVQNPAETYNHSLIAENKNCETDKEMFNIVQLMKKEINGFNSDDGILQNYTNFEKYNAELNKDISQTLIKSNI